MVGYPVGAEIDQPTFELWVRLQEHSNSSIRVSTDRSDLSVPVEDEEWCSGCTEDFQQLHFDCGRAR